MKLGCYFLISKFLLFCVEDPRPKNCPGGMKDAAVKMFYIRKGAKLTVLVEFELLFY